MNCENVAILLDDHADGRLDPDQWADVGGHLAHCEDCSSAWYGMQKLRSMRSQPVPPPRATLFAETMAMARNQPAQLTGNRRFWLGAGVGGALAAAMAWALVVFGPGLQPRTESAQPALTVALHETRNVDVAINSPRDVKGAQIRVLLSGTITLAGFESQQEIRWETDLDHGINMLSLPVTMEALSGGQLLVEVTYADGQKTFVVELNGAEAESQEPSATIPRKQTSLEVIA